ncbi:type II toxin-antitoxin system VapC family toxin [Anaerolineales bacterium HSG25]|nr:type II toxin-antitoxin system VapC family toxin [Anaerolineales bacterium HSG25]
MNLTEYSEAAPIFIDANIWTYFALNSEPFQESCSTFLYGIEIGQINGVTSTAVLNEVFYAILVGKASLELQSTKIKRIHRHLKQDTELSAICYQACVDFTTYIEALLEVANHRLIRWWWMAKPI